MPLYHCTTEHYVKDQVIGPFLQSRFSVNQKKNGSQWIEELLAKYRPGSQACSRENAVYAADAPENAARFLTGQHFNSPETPPVYCYEVAATAVSKAPMAVIRLIELSRENPELLEQLNKEYWEPKREWKFWEYFAPSMTVISEMPWPSDIAIWTAGAPYEADKTLGMGEFRVTTNITLIDPS